MDSIDMTEVTGSSINDTVRTSEFDINNLISQMNKMYDHVEVLNKKYYLEGKSQPIAGTTTLIKSLELILGLYVNILKEKTTDPKTKIVIHSQHKAATELLRSIGAHDIQCGLEEINAALLGFAQKHISVLHSK